jgi:dTDP-4-dehydrorhamnose 3,5-epimerase
MRFHPSEIDGVFVIEVDEIRDERGFFARSFCANEFASRELEVSYVQENIGFNDRKGTLRGLHYQIAPHEEVKLVRCVRGAVWDIAVDLRPVSATYGRWVGIELTEANRTSFYVPAGCAHGYLTLTDDAEIRYLTSAYYAPQAARGARYDDPLFAIDWPGEVTLVSDTDRNWPLASGNRSKVV